MSHRSWDSNPPPAALFVLAWKYLKGKRRKSGISGLSAGGEGQKRTIRSLHCSVSLFQAEHRHTGNTGWGTLTLVRLTPSPAELWWKQAIDNRPTP